MATALYDADHGFYATVGAAGRRGDFITSAEVGPLFGVCVGRYLDRVWDELGRPDPFTVVDAGAGPGTLARSVLAARPSCAGALRYVAVEVSAVQRAAHPSGVESRPDLPEGPFDGVIIANELLDNLPFHLWDHDPAVGWREVRVGPGFAEVLVPGDPGFADPGRAARQPQQGAARRWLADALGRVGRGRVVVLDYARRYPAPDERWLRTYRGHGRGDGPLVALGTQDITADVDLDQLAAVRVPDREIDQAEWLAGLGIGELVEEGRRVWRERAHLGDLAAVRGRSRVSEAEALLDPEGLGGYRVVEWRIG